MKVLATLAVTASVSTLVLAMAPGSAYAASGDPVPLPSTPNTSDPNSSPVLMMIQNHKSGYCLALRYGGVEGGVFKNGLPAIHAKCDPSASDQWWNVGNTMIWSQKTDKCLGLEHGGADGNGDAVIQTACSATATDQWWLAGPAGGMIKNYRTSKCWALQGGGATLGTKVIQSTCATTANDQRWLQY